MTIPMTIFRTTLVAALCGISCLEAADIPIAAPHVLMIIADDLGWGDVGFHQGTVPTPHLDKLAKESTELQNFHTYPVCSATRAAMLTGQMPRRFGIADVVGPQQNLPDNISTLPGTLRTAGYQTSLIGKWHLGKSGTPQNHGFDHFYGFLGPQIDYFTHTNQRGELDWQRDGKPLNEDGYSTYLFADEAIRQIKQRGSNHRFFITVAFNAVHIPNAAPAELMAKYQSLPDQEATRAAMIEALDTSIGRILGALDETGLRDQTLVVFFSDNGSGGRAGGSNAPLRGGKGTMFEGGIRTPCLLRWPNHLKPAAESQQLISVHDLFPTLAAAAGVKPPTTAKLDGKNLWDSIRTGNTQDRGTMIIAGSDLALFDSGWKLIETADGTRSLFRLADDPREATNLLAKNPAVAQRLAARLEEAKNGLPAAPPPFRPGRGNPAGRAGSPSP